MKVPLTIYGSMYKANSAFSYMNISLIQAQGSAPKHTSIIVDMSTPLVINLKSALYDYNPHIEQTNVTVLKLLEVRGYGLCI